MPKKAEHWMGDAPIGYRPFMNLPTILLMYAEQATITGYRRITPRHG